MQACGCLCFHTADACDQLPPCFCWHTSPAGMGCIIWKHKPKYTFPFFKLPFVGCLVTELRQVSLPYLVIWSITTTPPMYSFLPVSCPVCIHPAHSPFKAYKNICSVSSDSTTYIPVQVASPLSLMLSIAALRATGFLAYIPIISSLHSSQMMLPKCMWNSVPSQLRVLFLPLYEPKVFIPDMSTSSPTELASFCLSDISHLLPMPTCSVCHSCVWLSLCYES